MQGASVEAADPLDRAVDEGPVGLDIVLLGDDATGGGGRGGDDGGTHLVDCGALCSSDLVLAMRVRRSISASVSAFALETICAAS